MSVTFYLRSNETLYPACPTCGGTISHNPAPDQECEDPSCEGYGPDPVRSTPQLNVANDNARAILTGLLDQEPGCSLYGELDPSEVLRSLAAYVLRVDSMVEAPSQEANFYSCGRSEEQVDRYVVALHKIATLAKRRGELVIFD